MLSVLPLRVVLVPSDISGLTRVDLVLGFGLVSIVAVAAGKYVYEIWTLQSNQQAEGDGIGEREEESVPDLGSGATLPAPGE